MLFVRMNVTEFVSIHFSQCSDSCYFSRMIEVHVPNRVYLDSQTSRVRFALWVNFKLLCVKTEVNTSQKHPSPNISRVKWKPGPLLVLIINNIKLAILSWIIRGIWVRVSLFPESTKFRFSWKSIIVSTWGVVELSHFCSSSGSCHDPCLPYHWLFEICTIFTHF